METQELRREVKLLIPGFDSGNIEQSILNLKDGFSKEYPDRVVNNLYFDSPDLDNYFDNLSGLSHRSKVRLRWYGYTGWHPEKLALEIKSRDNIFCKKVVCPIDQPINLLDPWDTVISKLLSQQDFGGEYLL